MGDFFDKDSSVRQAQVSEDRPTLKMIKDD